MLTAECNNPVYMTNIQHPATYHILAIIEYTLQMWFQVGEKTCMDKDFCKYN